MAKYVRTEEGYKDYNEIRSTPDWSDNNELSPNYIKNRTHYDLRELLWLVGNEDTLETITLDRTFYEYHNSSRGVSLHIIDNVNINTADKPVAQITYYDNNGQLRTYKVNLPIEYLEYNNNWKYLDDVPSGYIPSVNIDGCKLDLVYYTISHTLTVGLNFDDGLPRTSMILSLCIISGELVQLADKYISQNIARTKDVIAKTNEIEYIPTKNYHPATKKYVDDILQKIYPIGAIYLSMNSTSPASLFGGTWEQIEDVFLLGAGSAYTAGSTGGSTTHTHDVAMRFASYYNSMVMENHEKTGIVAYDEDGTKTATGNTRIGYTGESENSLVNSGAQNGRTDIGSFGVYETVGNTSYHSSMPPYLAVYIWKRIE